MKRRVIARFFVCVTLSTPIFSWAGECFSMSKPSKIRKIALMIAMKEEAKPIIARLNLSQKGALDKALPMEVYTSTHVCGKGHYRFD